MLLRKLSFAVVLIGQFAPPSCGLTLEETRSRLSQAFSSPSGKLTYSPELVIPEPSDITAILLQTNAVQILSSRIRAAKANSVFVQGSVQALQTFVREQETARGGFPGPVPVIYCSVAANIPDVAETGAEGLLLRVCEGKEYSSLDALDQDTMFVEAAKVALKYGLQPIPEVTIAEESAASWTEVDVTKLVDKLSVLMGCDPVALLLSVNPKDDEDEREEPIALPPVPKSLRKRVQILGSVRKSGGEGRLGKETNRFKDAGFAGAFLRSDCVPGFRMNMDLDLVSQFWGACIDDLKSTRSKSFSFRSRNNMEKSVGTQWANLQNSVISSGALGDPNEQVSIMDDSSGDYQGF